MYKANSKYSWFFSCDLAHATRSDFFIIINVYWMPYVTGDGIKETLEASRDMQLSPMVTIIACGLEKDVT